MSLHWLDIDKFTPSTARFILFKVHPAMFSCEFIRLTLLHLETLASLSAIRLMLHTKKHLYFSSSLWKVDTELLCEVCARDDQFFRFYKKSVLQWATEMEPVYGLTTEGDLYKWR